MSYVPEAYDSLPSLRLAGELFRKKNAAEQLLGPIRQLFLDRGLYHKYEISLLHKHFPIQATERLVDYHHVASPWMVATARRDAERLMASIKRTMVARSSQTVLDVPTFHSETLYFPKDVCLLWLHCYVASYNSLTSHLLSRS
jgi:hypothetical protein